MKNGSGEKNSSHNKIKSDNGQDADESSSDDGHYQFTSRNRRARATAKKKTHNDEHRQHERTMRCPVMAG